MKVKCIDASDQKYLTIGKIYEAEIYDSTYYRILLDDKGLVNYFYKERFEVVEEEKPLMKVRCIDNESMRESINFITIGKIYNVIGSNEERYYIVNDKGAEIGYLKERFVVVEPGEEFEPITAENVRQVLEYNGFTTGHGEVFQKDGIIFIVDKDYYFKINDNEYICSKDLDKVLEFAKEFIDLKPLPKKKEFDPVQFLIDKGFKEIDDDGGYTDFELGTFWCRLNEDRSKIYLNNRAGWEKATKETLELIVQAAKVLEKLQ